MDYLADYQEAQSAGHHVDCDGFMTAHRVTIKADRREGVLLYRAVCDECGALHAGSFGDQRDASRFSDHSHEVRCDGRCVAWKKG